jgi:hypothetical protein
MCLFISMIAAVSNKPVGTGFGLAILIIGYPIGLLPAFIAAVIFFLTLRRIPQPPQGLGLVRIFLCGACAGLLGVIFPLLVLAFFLQDLAISLEMMRFFAPIGILSGGVYSMFAVRYL